MAGWDIIVLSIVMVFSHHRITGCLRDTVQTSLSISGTIYVPLSTGCLVLVTAVSACSLCFSTFSVTFLVIPVSVFLGLFSLRRFMKEPPAPHAGRDVFKSSVRSEWHDGYGAMSPLRACCCNEKCHLPRPLVTSHTLSLGIPGEMPATNYSFPQAPPGRLNHSVHFKNGRI